MFRTPKAPLFASLELYRVVKNQVLCLAGSLRSKTNHSRPSDQSSENIPRDAAGGIKFTARFGEAATGINVLK